MIYPPILPAQSYLVLYFLGDRVPYVIVEGGGGGGGRMALRAEDPDHVRAHGLAYDVRYYIEKQMKGPLERVLGPVVGTDRVSAVFAKYLAAAAAAAGNGGRKRKRVE